jgi:hypothetical protein
MRRRAEADDLSGTGEQDDLHTLCLLWQRALQESAEDMLQLSQPTQDGCSKGAGESAVTPFEGSVTGPRARFRQHVIERPTLQQDAGNEAVGQVARRPTRSGASRLALAVVGRPGRNALASYPHGPLDLPDAPLPQGPDGAER